MVLSQHKREIYRRKIENFWMDFSHNKVGFLGLIIIIGFVIVGVFAPLLTPYEPATILRRPPRVADVYAAPIWFKIFPMYSEETTTANFPANLGEATLADQEGPVQVNIEKLNLNFTPPEDTNATASVTVDLGTIDYTQACPPAFTMYVAYNMTFNGTGLRVYFIIKNYTSHPTWELFNNPHSAEMLIGSYTPPVGGYYITNVTTNSLKADDYTSDPMNSLFGSTSGPHPAPLMFPIPDVYGIQVKFEFFNVEPFKDTYARLYFTGARIITWGGVHGVLGTNTKGNDVWTELVYGARISLMVGVLAALVGTSIGIFYGVISGYIGGFVDEFLMRLVDVLLCIPVLPILLVLARFFNPNVFFIVVLIAIFGWQGLSRVIRSRVLSLKEMAFIESARASGASDLYLITRHLIPNVLPIAMSAMVLAVPGAIITEAALSFLGFGDPNQATWGRMLYDAYQHSGLPYWWVWITPGLAITVICIGFVFMGHAIDEIINPRLRRRR